jgi:hypothetical protein
MSIPGKTTFPETSKQRLGARHWQACNEDPGSKTWRNAQRSAQQYQVSFSAAEMFCCTIM